MVQVLPIVALHHRPYPCPFLLFPLGPLDFHILTICPFSSLTPEHPSAPSEYARMVVYAVLEPVLQGLRGLPPEAQAPALSQALTATLGAWLDHILTHGIRFRWEGKMVVAEGMPTGKMENIWELKCQVATLYLDTLACRGRCSSNETSEWSGSFWNWSSGACPGIFARLCSPWASSSGWMGPCYVYCSSPCPRIQSTEGIHVAVSH